MSSTTQSPGGLGSHTGGNGHRSGGGPDVVVNSGVASAASNSTVTNQQILLMPNSVHEVLPAKDKLALSIIEIQFALDVSKALTSAYESVLTALRRSGDQAGPADQA